MVWSLHSWSNQVYHMRWHHCIHLHRMVVSSLLCNQRMTIRLAVSSHPCNQLVTIRCFLAVLSVCNLVSNLHKDIISTNLQIPERMNRIQSQFPMTNLLIWFLVNLAPTRPRQLSKPSHSLSKAFWIKKVTVRKIRLYLIMRLTCKNQTSFQRKNSSRK